MVNMHKKTLSLVRWYGGTVVRWYGGSMVR